MVKSDIGIIGLGAMGRSLALNFSRHGFAVSVFNPDISGEEDLLAQFLHRHGCDTIKGFRTMDSFAASLATPKKIMLMIKAGKPVDDMIRLAAPYFTAGDIIIDGGNSRYTDSEQRAVAAGEKGIHYVGCGVSGGIEGALRGPCLMPGGSAGAWADVKPLFQAIAAKTDRGSFSCEWIGPGGSGHFVKMVHNGIEYALMQVIAEAFDIMKRMLALTPEAISGIVAQWNESDLSGYLVQIAADILRKKEKGSYLLDTILDQAGDKGTGRDAMTAALLLSVPVPVAGEALWARMVSSLSEERGRASRAYGPLPAFSGKAAPSLDDLFNAVYCSAAISFAQGFALLKKASEEYGWSLDYAAIARIWRAGSIIRADMLRHIEEAFASAPVMENIILAPYFIERLKRGQQGWRRTAAQALLHGIPVPALSAALAWFDSYRSERLPANLVQAMRDYLGGHGFERAGGPRGKLFHHDWANDGECGGLNEDL